MSIRMAAAACEWGGEVAGVWLVGAKGSLCVPLEGDEASGRTVVVEEGRLLVVVAQATGVKEKLRRRTATSQRTREPGRFRLLDTLSMAANIATTGSEVGVEPPVHAQAWAAKMTTTTFIAMAPEGLQSSLAP